MTAIRSTHRTHSNASSALLWLLRVADAGLLVASGLIHLHLWDIAYQHVGTLDVLFPLQFALCLLAALAVLVLPRLLVVLAAAALMAGTMVGFVLARTVGIFGFHLTFSSGLAWTVLTVEAAGVVVLTLTGWALVRARSQPAPAA
ncbi:MAG TPA: hypothetical protein VGH27_23555 [Streptosporangiaceae bacterium]